MLARAEASSTCPAPTPRLWRRPRPCPPTRSFSISRIRSPPTRRSRRAAQVAEAVRKGGFGGREVVIRVNGPHTPWGDDDLAAAAAAGPDAILLPKVDGPGAIMAAARALREAGAPERTRIWAMMETPNAVLNAGSIAAVAADSDLAPDGDGDGAQRSRQGDAGAAHPRAPDDDRLARKLRHRGARPRRRHHRRRLQRHQGSRRLPPRMPARPRHGPRRQDAHPPQSDRHLQRGVRARARGGRKRPRHHRSLRAARERRQGRNPAQRPDGRTPARRHGAPDAGDRDAIAALDKAAAKRSRASERAPRRQTFFSRTITSIAAIDVPSGAGISNSGTHSSGMSDSSSVSSR